MWRPCRSASGAPPGHRLARHASPQGHRCPELRRERARYTQPCPRTMPVSRRTSPAKIVALLAIVSTPVAVDRWRLTEPVDPSRTGLLAP